MSRRPGLWRDGIGLWPLRTRPGLPGLRLHCTPASPGTDPVVPSARGRPQVGCERLESGPGGLFPLLPRGPRLDRARGHWHTLSGRMSVPGLALADRQPGWPCHGPRGWRGGLEALTMREGGEARTAGRTARFLAQVRGMRASGQTGTASAQPPWAIQAWNEGVTSKWSELQAP